VIFGKGSGFNNIYVSTLQLSEGFKIYGANSNDNSGCSVSSALDINNDGYDDIIIGARYTDSNGIIDTGVSYVIFGKGSEFNNINLQNLTIEQGFQILGENEYDYSGWSVAAGYLNGDTHSDIIIGAPNADPNNNNKAGIAYVIYGTIFGNSTVSPSASPTISASAINLNTISPSQGFSVIGISDSYSGWSVSDAGDVNNDGYADVIIGAYAANSYAGESYVIYGGSYAFSSINIADLTSSQGFSITGSIAGDQSGYSVSGAGDVNGDGYSDVIIGAPYTNSRAGVSYVIYGGSSIPFFINLTSLTSSQGFSVIGASYSYSGYSVSGAGDVNNDGYDDLLIGAIYASDAKGESYVIYGKDINSGTINLAILDSSQGFTIEGKYQNGHNGCSVSGVGDINGDTYDDIIIGSQSGNSYIVYGAATGYSFVSLENLLSAEGFYIDSTYSSAGWSVSGAGDINKDGYSDIIIGDPYAGQVSGYYYGESYIIYGAASGVITSSPTSRPSSAPTIASTMKPTSIPTSAPTTKPTSIPSFKPSIKPTYTPSISPTSVPTVVPSAMPTQLPTAVPTLSPTKLPTFQPTVAPTIEPTAEPTVTPTAPTFTPTITPTFVPSVIPTKLPTVEPTAQPTVIPTIEPTSQPTNIPTLFPTQNPTISPTPLPTKDPTIEPSAIPTIPTFMPTMMPTSAPTVIPTKLPTVNPTVEPTQNPTAIPTLAPSKPTLAPTIALSSYPTMSPTSSPTEGPTASPTLSPTVVEITESNSSVDDITSTGVIAGVTIGGVIALSIGIAIYAKLYNLWPFIDRNDVLIKGAEFSDVATTTVYAGEVGMFVDDGLL
jgi:hypothetical protein